jgi:hypothetical protein
VANWSNPTLTSLYTDFVNEVKNRDVDLALGLDPATTSPTNIPTNAIRWNSANKRWEKYDGTNWNALSTAFSVPMGAQGTPSIYFGTTADAGLYSPGAGQVAISTGGTGRVFVTSGGLVGIGQASPGSALDVAGELRVYPSSGAGIIRFGSGGAEKGKVSVDASSNFAVETAGTERLRITSTGDVNIKGAGTAGSTQAVSFSGSAPVDSLVLTSAGNVGLGTSSVSNTAGYGRQLEVAGTLPCITINQNDAGFTTRKYSIGVGTTGGLSIWDNNASAHRLSITSGGLVGIGIANPGSKLEVQGLGSASGYTSAGNAGIKVDFGAANNGVINLVGGGDLGIYHSNSSGAYDVGISFGDNSNRILRFDTAGGEKMRLDASGNLGLGVTPSAFYSTVKALQVGALGGTVITGNTSAGGTSVFGQNFYADPTTAAVKYAAGSQPATLYSQYAGEHRWSTASAGTANANITFTQAMTLDASGRLGVGVTSPSNTLDVNGTARFRLGGTNQLVVSTDSGNPYLYVEQNAPLNFGTNSQIRATLDSSGRLLVGTTSAASTANKVEVVTASGGVGFSTYSTLETSLRTSYAAYAGLQLAAYQSDSGSPYTKNVDIVANSDGTVPSQMRFLTKADGAASPTERARINNQGYLTGTVNGLSRGIYPSKQYYRLNADYTGTNVSTSQSMFGVGVTLVSNTVYEFESVFALTNGGSLTNHVLYYGFAGTAVVDNIFFVGNGPGQAGLIGTDFYDTSPTSFYSNNTATVTTMSGTISSSALTLYSIIYTVKGTLSVGAGGTLIPSYSCSVAPGAAYKTARGSYFNIWPLGASGSNISIGSWA